MSDPDSPDSAAADLVLQDVRRGERPRGLAAAGIVLGVLACFGWGLWVALAGVYALGAAAVGLAAGIALLALPPGRLPGAPGQRAQ